MSDKKQSSVEWLVEKIQQANPSFKFDGLIRQAKEMEKQQIIEAMDRMGNTDFYCEFDCPEQYYKEIYGDE